MKKLISILAISLTIACNHPIRVTTIPDQTNATSGTLGSARFQNRIPEPLDTFRVKLDTPIVKRDTLKRR